MCIRDRFIDRRIYRRDAEDTEVTQRIKLLAGTQKDLPFASSQNKHLTAIADLPALHAWRRRYVLVNNKTFVGEFFHRIRFDREAGSGRHGQSDRPIAG